MFFFPIYYLISSRSFAYRFMFLFLVEFFLSIFSLFPSSSLWFVIFVLLSLLFLFYVFILNLQFLFSQCWWFIELFPSQMFICNLFFTALEPNKRYFDRAPTLKFSTVSSCVGYLNARKKSRRATYFFLFRPYSVSFYSFQLLRCIDLLLLSKRTLHIHFDVDSFDISGLYSVRPFTAFNITDTRISLIFLSVTLKWHRRPICECLSK